MKDFRKKVGVALLYGVTLSAGSAWSLERPNILWLTSEDNNVTHLGCYGNKMANTPNLDRLAKEGFRYTHTYSNGAVCSASRSTWITGMLSSSTGLHHHRSSVDIPRAVTLYPTVLRDAGYFTVNTKKTDYNISHYDKSTWDKNSETVDWAELKNHQPFFQVLNSTESHESHAMGTDHVHDSSEVVIAPYHPDIPVVRDNYAHYYDAVTRMDDDIGRALAELEKLGVADHTIVIYNSDHGGPLPRGKRVVYNSGTHCPLIIRIPEKYKHLWPAAAPGSTVDRLVSFVDMPATWISLAGGKIPSNYQGRVFLGPEQEVEAEYHFSFRGRGGERVENVRAIRDKRFLYVKNYLPFVPRGQCLEYQWWIPMQRAWEEHYLAGKADANQSRFYEEKANDEFYDTQKDPYCLNNLMESPEYKGKVAELKQQLNLWQVKQYDAVYIPESELNKMAADHGITAYEVLRSKALYNIEAYHPVAEVALAADLVNLPLLKEYLHSNDPVIRYWAATGIMMLGADAGILKEDLLCALNDSSHTVRAMAAWALIKLDEKDPAYAALNTMIENKSYALLEILNVLAWMEDDAQPVLPAVASLNRLSATLQKIQYYVLHGQKPLSMKPMKQKRVEK